VTLAEPIGNRNSFTGVTGLAEAARKQVKAKIKEGVARAREREIEAGVASRVSPGCTNTAIGSARNELFFRSLSPH